jgi:S-(hydroxymethyl)glutathione dehydrogenase/alcohol dehydrogenase
MSKPIRFRAAILKENGRPLGVEEIEFAGPLLAGQVFVKLDFSGICGKQIEEIDGKGGYDAFLPHLLGHEGSGEVIDVGPGVKKVKVGDVVVMHWRKGSGINSATPEYHWQGKKINAGWVTTFNEYSVVSENRVTPIPRGNDMKVAALLGCVITTGVGVVFNKANVQSYDTVVVVGCGGVGLCAVQGAKLRQPAKLIAVDVNQNSLDKAKEFGATHLINAAKENVMAAINELTNRKGASKVIVCTGHPKAIEQAVESTAVPGECFLVGVPPKGCKVEIDPWKVMHERNIAGTLGGDSYPDRDIPAYLELYNKGLLRIDDLISCVEPFDNINKAINLMRGETAGRCMVKF